MAAIAKIQHGKFKETAMHWGFDIVYPNLDEPTSSRTSIKYEIVAIPGLGTDQQWSWGRDKVNWLKDTNMLQSKIPGARISHFCYKRDYFGKGSVDQRLDNVAEKLVRGLDHIRRNNKTKTPIIFVCHSLGGLILAKALLFAQSNQNEYPYVYTSVTGAIFLGTPFHGMTEPRAQVLASMAEGIGMEPTSSLVKYLDEKSDTLDNLLDRFGILVTDAKMRLYCFYEKQVSNAAKREVVKGLKASLKELIVDERSATITSVVKQGLAVDHFNLNKFENAKDPHYTYVSEEIRITTEEADRILKSKQKAERTSVVEESVRCSMRDHLASGFQDINAAMYGQAKAPTVSKLSDVLELPAYTDWEKGSVSRLLWVHGEAGTGQDAITSSAIVSLKKLKDDRKNDSIVTSFYCDQNDKTRRSLAGLLKMVLRQIIEGNQDLAEYLLSDSKKNKQAGKQEFDPESLKKVPVLWDIMQTMADHLPSGSIYIVVYGFEQLDEESLNTFLGYMTDLSKASTSTQESSEMTPIKWMLVSRTGRSDIKKSLQPGALEINLEDKDSAALVSSDLKFYISISVDDLKLPSSLAYFVKRHIYSRAEHNRIYVDLVIQELKNAWTPGETQHADIRKLLESFPFGLTNMFDHIRRRVLHPKAVGLEYTKEILRCLICAHVAPKLRELAIIAGLPKEDQQDLQKLKRYLVRCGAFLTLYGGDWDLENATVEWIDLSAQEYLEQYAKDDPSFGLQDVDMQNGIIALRSLEYVYERFEEQHADENQEAQDQNPDLDADETGIKSNVSNNNQTRDDENENDNGVNHNDDDDDDDENDENKNDNDNAVSIGSNSDEQDDNEQDENTFDEDDTAETLVDDGEKYPLLYWVQHAKVAPVDVLDEIDLYQPFWEDNSKIRQRWWESIPEEHTWYNQNDLSALHVAVILQFPSLVKHLLKNGKEDDINKIDSLNFQPLYYACEKGNKEIVTELLQKNADVNHNNDATEPTALLGAASEGFKDIVEILLDRKANLDAPSKDYGTPLYAAIENEHSEIADLLLKRGASVNTISGPALRALNIGASVGNLEGVRTLLDHGADIDPEEEYWYGSALGVASRNGHAEIVELLLSRGWNPKREMNTYGSFLTAAASHNHLEVVEILLKQEDRVPTLQTALQIAAKKGYASVVKAILTKNSALLLLKAFSLAANHGKAEVLELLFEMDSNCEIMDNPSAMNDALYQATDNERAKAIDVLLQHGADPNAEGS